MDLRFLVLDVETCPLELDDYFDLEEAEQRSRMNSIDSRIVAAGINFEDRNFIFWGEDEEAILRKFWHEFGEITSVGRTFIGGFNLKNFDLPFLVNRSFIQNVPISPFLLKDVVEIREKLNCFRWGKTRGKLKEYAELLGIETDGDGSMIAGLVRDEEWNTIQNYLRNDLDITNAIMKRLIETRIVEIERYYPLK
jgi:DNA polymerase elongation subunit (family B)